ncbi:FAD-dependent oxidoreductase [Streptomyces sp. AC602_WCS936]|uniref:FAD-dependent oxidoreductase n=1 Tax=Streptomyces sp. AC602_WCS936 TaxID=2823685 RepID=UPI001C26FBAD|nr:FAD-dependent oxidoreductase [Streptomyces sp. AC602_WCS936]
MSAEPPADVLVVGAGPVGLTAAHELARRGLRVRLVDAAAAPARTSRAVAVHPRTLETLDQMGTVGPLLREGRENRAFTMYAGGSRLVRLEADYATMPTRYPYTLVVEQTRTEAVLRAAVARLGVDVEWGVALTGFEQDATGVRAVLRHGDGREEEFAAHWLVGCDGGHSTVRKRLGLPLVGDSRDTWMLADAPVDTDLPQDSIYWVHTGGQALMMVPYAREGHWRLLDTAPGPDGADGARERLSARLSAGLGRPVRVGEPEWTSVFTFQQRMVPRMREGRVFVAGDAAHVHSPASGQGMNTGIQEAYNLAWKLALVHRGHAAHTLLDSYGEERVPVGRALLGSTRTATFLVQLKNALAAVALPVVFGVVRNVPPLRRAIQRKVLGGISGLRLHYAAGSLTTGGGPEPVPLAAPVDAPVMVPRRPGVPAPGERAAMAAVAAPALAAELRDVRCTLLFVPGGHGPDARCVRTAAGAAARHGAWLSVRTVGPGPGPAPLADPGGALRAALRLGAGGWALIRPDGYLAARGDLLTPAALEEALRALHVRPATGPAAVLERDSSTRRAERDTVGASVGVPTAMTTGNHRHRK